MLSLYTWNTSYGLVYHRYIPRHQRCGADLSPEIQEKRRRRSRWMTHHHTSAYETIHTMQWGEGRGLTTNLLGWTHFGFVWAWMEEAGKYDVMAKKCSSEVTINWGVSARQKLFQWHADLVWGWKVNILDRTAFERKMMRIVRLPSHILGIEMHWFLSEGVVAVYWGGV